jgi:hypothetical protein
MILSKAGQILGCTLCITLVTQNFVSNSSFCLLVHYVIYEYM